VPCRSFCIKARKRNKREKVLRATPHGQRKFFDMLFKQAFRPAQPDLFLAEEIARLRIAPPNETAN
jgi:hypothetical protein